MDKMFEMMINIRINKIKNENSLSALAKKLKIYPTSPVFRRMIKLMENNDIISYKLFVLNAKAIIIDLKKLEEYIKKNSEEFKMCDEFIHKTNKLAIT